MRAILASIAICASLCLALPQPQAAARQQVQKAGTEIKTEYFSVRIPEGWIMPGPIHKQPGGGISAVFALEKGDLAITLNIIPAAINIAEYAKRLVEDMKKNGLKTGSPEKKGKFYKLEISGKVAGEGWFGQAGGLTGVTILFGRELGRAPGLLGAIKPLEPGLIPASIR